MPPGRAEPARFVWDAEKERRNRVKHGFDFSLATAVFADPLHQLRHDRFQDGEDRWHCLGVPAASSRVLLVVHCYPDSKDQSLVRVIGLRRATPSERRSYEHDDTNSD